jgi:hypothetical protein
VYQWTVHGTNGKWEGDALKYRLTGGEGGGVVFRLFIVAPGVQMEINACGHLVGLLNADGELQKQPVKLKGTRIEVA